jgi:sodium/bile acid cotransporter 7
MTLLKKNGFVLALLGAVVLAYLFPGLGASNGILKAGLFSKIGVMVIFFLQGLTINTGDLASGLRQIKLHLFIQSWTYLFSPVVLVSVALVLNAFDHDALAGGFFYIALIPTTISSAVAFTSAAGGNVPASIFNTTISNILGVFWVPTGCWLIFAAGGQLQFDSVGPLLLKIAQLILLPLVAGQIVRPLFSGSTFIRRVAPSFRLINHSIILFIVFAAFCQSFLSSAWDDVAATSIILLLVLSFAAVLLVHAGVWISSAWVADNRADRITALFCGSQKTLATGAPMAVAIFSNGNGLAEVNIGLIILPLLCYHPMQLLLAAVLLAKLKN